MANPRSSVAATGVACSLGINTTAGCAADSGADNGAKLIGGTTKSPTGLCTSTASKASGAIGVCASAASTGSGCCTTATTGATVAASSGNVVVFFRPRASVVFFAGALAVGGRRRKLAKNADPRNTAPLPAPPAASPNNVTTQTCSNTDNKTNCRIDGRSVMYGR